jgi:hypothetical protein
MASSRAATAYGMSWQTTASTNHEGDATAAPISTATTTHSLYSSVLCPILISEQLGLIY